MRNDYQEKLVRQDRNIELFNEKAMDCMETIADLAAMKKRIEAQDKKQRKILGDLFDYYGVEKIDNDFVRINKIEASESVSVDLRALEKAEPDLYDEMLRDYPKIIKRKAYIKITPKEIKKDDRETV